MLPTMGGQTALNVAMALARIRRAREVRRRADRRDARAIAIAEDRKLFGEAMERIGLAVAAGRHRRELRRSRGDCSSTTGFPAIIRPSFTLGGTGGGIAYNREEFEQIVRSGLDLSPTHQVLIERSVIGWKEFELEVMRDHEDNVVIVCSIENLDPMGVHTGDSITVAPAMTLTDREYQMMRDAAVAIIREIGVDAGGCNIQFAVNPRERRDARHRDEPARVAVVGARVEGDRISDRAHRREARRRLPAGRDPERHHEDDAGVVRAGARLRRREDSAVRVREISDGEPVPHDADEVGRRVDGDRPHVQGSVSEGTARARDRPPRLDDGAAPAGRPAAGRNDRVAARRAAPADAGADLPGQARAGARAVGRRDATSSRRSTRGSSQQMRELVEAEREYAALAERDARTTCAA